MPSTTHPSPTDRDQSVTPIIEMKGISKYFGNVRALHDVDFDLMPNEVLALVGDNGAGKSTLIKCLAGVHQPTQGTIYVDGQPVVLRSPNDATRLGISVVYQDLALVNCRDAASNIFLGREPTRGPFIVDKRRMTMEARELLNGLKIRIPSVSALVGLMSGGQRQAIAIARAISMGGRVVIMDEPTAALGVEESQKILELIAELREQGKSVIVISHNLAHVFSIADRIFVLRGGERQGVVRKEETTPEQVVGMITGAYAASGSR